MKKVNSKNNNNELIEAIIKISSEITKNISLEEVIQSIIDLMADTVGAFGGAIFLTNKTTNSVDLYKLIQTKLGYFATKILKEKVENLSTPLNNPVNLVGKTAYKSKTYISENLEDFIYPTVSKKNARLIQKIGELGLTCTYPIVMQNETIGVILLAFKKNEIEIPKKKRHLISFFTDQAAIAINNAMKFEELQREHEKVQLLYEIEKETSALLSHELKTPIAIAYNNIQLFKNKLEESDDEEPAIKELNKLQKNMERGVTRIDEICTAIFKLREIENHVPDINQKLDLQHSLGQVFAVYKERAKTKGLQFKSSIRVRAKDKMGPGVQFEQVLVTLLDNAIKYTDKGYVEVKVNLNQKTLKAVVSDSGPGIKEKDKDEIFKRFKRLKKNKANTEGLGLGLYIAKTILEQLGGTMKVEKNPKNRGSQFTICIPVQE